MQGFAHLDFYSVYDANYDGDFPGQDLFYEIRRAYFESGEPAKNRASFQEKGRNCRAVYAMERGRPMKWKLTVDGRTAEKSHPTGAGGYCVESFDTERRLRKIAYFTADHVWTCSKYYAKSNAQTPEAILSREDEGDALLLFQSGMMDEDREQRLFPCELPYNQEEKERLNAAAGEPPVRCRTSQGEFYYCCPEERMHRAQLLLSIRQDMGTASGPVWPKREERRARTEPAESADRAEASQPMQEPQRPAEAVHGVSYQWGSSVDSREQDKLLGLAEEPQTAEPEMKPEAEIMEEPAGPTGLLEEGAQRREAPEQTSDGPQDGGLPALAESRNTVEPGTPDEWEETSESGNTAGLSADEQTALPAPSEEQENGAAETSGSDETQEAPAQQGEPEPFAEEGREEAEEPERQPEIRRYNVLVKPIGSDTYFSAEGAWTRRNDVSGGEDGAESPDRMDADQEAEYESSPLFAQGEAGGWDKEILTDTGERYYYYGPLEDGQRHGRGRTAMPDGRTAYEGEYACDRREGFGVYYYNTGRLCYAGDWRDNQRHGTGVSFRPQDGMIHVGRWEEDRPSGMGARFDAKGNLLYSGKWEEGRRQGAGITYRAEDGSIFIGQWKDDALTGLGSEFGADGSLLYTGYWKHCRRDGHGTEFGPEGKIVYTGAFRDGRYHGEGTLFFPDGRRIQGSFCEGKPCGFGREFAADDTLLYEGEFKNGSYHGQGKCLRTDGHYDRGSFEEGCFRLSGRPDEARARYEAWREAHLGKKE